MSYKTLPVKGCTISYRTYNKSVQLMANKIVKELLEEFLLNKLSVAANLQLNQTLYNS